MGGIPVLFIVAFAVIVILGIIFGSIAEKKRREEIAAWCRARGLVFNAVKDSTFDDRYGTFNCLRHGDSRYAKYQMEGDFGGRHCTFFTYHYETHSTDSKGRRQTHHHYLSGAILRSNIMLEDLLIRPENFFDKIAGVVGFDDIDFESAEFSRRFYVKAKDRKWAYDVIHARTMEFLLGQPRVAVQFHANLVMAWKSGHMKPPEFEQTAGVANGILDRLPKYVIEQQQVRT